MSELRTCRWCTFFAAMEGESCCNLCKPFLGEQAAKAKAWEERTWDFDSREEALALLADAVQSKEDASDWNELSDADFAIDRCELWLATH